MTLASHSKTTSLHLCRRCGATLGEKYQARVWSSFLLLKAAVFGVDDAHPVIHPCVASCLLLLTVRRYIFCGIAMDVLVSSTVGRPVEVGWEEMLNIISIIRSSRQDDDLPWPRNNAPCSGDNFHSGRVDSLLLLVV